MLPTYPAPLRPGSLIAVTAPSSGVEAPLQARLDLVIQHLKHQGFRVHEGHCLRSNHKHVSAPRHQRAAEFMALLLDDEVDAIFPPWGGELGIELLTLLDFDAVARARPKWLLGFSDISTLMLAITLRCGWATAHGPNLMDLAPGQNDSLTRHALLPLMSAAGAVVEQQQSALWQGTWEDFAVNPAATYRLTEPTCWRPLPNASPAAAANPVEFSGRLIGGCLDTLMHLTGSAFGDVPSFIRGCRHDGAILYLENDELPPPQLSRALWSLRLAGWFDGVNGVLLGRTRAPDAALPGDLSAAEALAAVLCDLPCPVLCDVDIGHVPPQMTLINGARATVHWSAAGGGRLSQRLS